jgi:hypothetical protein
VISLAEAKAQLLPPSVDLLKRRTLYEVDQGAEDAQVVDGRGKGGEGPVKSFGGPD